MSKAAKLWNYLIPSVILPVCLLLPSITHAEVTPLHVFPIGTWIENLAVRGNGFILATSASAPELFQVDPHNEESASIISRIPAHTALSGITEVEPDVFYVGANNFSAKGPTVQPNSSAVYRINASEYQSGLPLIPTLIANFPTSILLNGLTTLDFERGLILVADSGKGWVWRLNVHTGDKVVVISDPLMRVIDTSKEPIGVNGIKVRHGYLYWSNTNQEILARIPISEDGIPTGPAAVVTQYAAPDDFIFCTHPAERGGILAAGDDKVRLISETVVKLLSDSPLLKGSTALATARAHRNRIYISSNGGVAQYASGNVTVPGKILTFDLK